MKRNLSEPVTLIALGAVIAALALWGRGNDTEGAEQVFYGGVVMMAIGGAWWLAKGHLAEYRRKRAEKGR